MRTTTTSIGNLTYPDEICFAFNPTYVKLTDCSLTSVNVRLSAVAGSHVLDFKVYGGKLVANLARTIQLFFDTYTIIDCRTVNVYVELLNGGDAVFGFHTIAIWGNIAPGETFNGPRLVRWFDKWPQLLSVFTGGTIQDLEVDDEQYYAVSPWDYTFDYTFRATAIANITFVHDKSEDGLFLRWIDRHGFLQYWLFDKGVRKSKNSQGGNELTMNYVDGDGNSFRNIKRQQYFFSEVTQDLCAPNVSEEEYRMLEGILTSPVIDLFHPSGIIGWEPVQIAKGTNKCTTSILQDFEFTIELPNINAQSL